MIPLSTTPGITSTRFAIHAGPSSSRKQCWIMRSSSIRLSSLSRGWKPRAFHWTCGPHNYTPVLARLPHLDASSVRVYPCGKRLDSSGAIAQARVLWVVTLFIGPRLQEVFNQPLPRQFTWTLQFLNFLFQLWTYADLDNLTFGHRTSPITSRHFADRKHTDVHACLQGLTYRRFSSLRCLTLSYRENSFACYMLQRTQRTLMGVCPCQWCIVVVGAIDHDISGLAMEERETGIDPDPMKPHTTGQKRLRPTIRDVGRRKQMGNLLSLPPLARCLPQTRSEAAAIGWQEKAADPASQDRAVRTVRHIMQPQRSSDMAIDQAYQQLLRPLGYLKTEVRQSIWECIGIGHRQVVTPHSLPPDAHLFYGRSIGHHQRGYRQRCQERSCHICAPSVRYTPSSVCHPPVRWMYTSSPSGATGYATNVRDRRVTREAQAARGQSVCERHAI